MAKAALFYWPIYTPSAPPPFPPPWFYETQSVIGGREGSMGLRVIEREQGRRMWMEHLRSRTIMLSNRLRLFIISGYVAHAKKERSGF